MNVYIVIGLYGVGKTTLVRSLGQMGWATPLSLDHLDKSTRREPSRIRDLYERFQHHVGTDHPIDEHTFQTKYFQALDANRGSLLTTLVQLASELCKDAESDPEKIRQNVLRPSIFNLMFQKVSGLHFSNVIVDSGAMDFEAMDSQFFDHLEEMANITVIHLKADPAISLHNLMSTFEFLDRGFFKDIRQLIQCKFGHTVPTDRSDAIEFLVNHPDVSLFVQQQVDRILSESAKKLDQFEENLDYPVVTFQISQMADYVTLPDRVREELGLHMKLIQQKPEAIFFDLSSTIIDSHKFDLAAVDSVLTEYGRPKWSEGTSAKKDVAKSMKENFVNFFAPEDADQAYKEYIAALIKQIPNMSLIPGAKEVLDYCQQNDILTVLLSNRDAEFVQEAIKCHQLEKYFPSGDASSSRIVTADGEGITKPHPNMVLQPCRRLHLDHRRVVALGDAFADVGCAFASGSIPVLFTAVVREEISVQDRDTLVKLFPHNPLRLISSMKEFHHLLQASKAHWENEEKLGKEVKITYIGAMGKVGSRALQYITSSVPSDAHVDLVLMASDHPGSIERLTGFSKDLRQSLFADGKAERVRVTVTSDYALTRGSCLVICSAGRWPSPQATLSSADPSLRLGQSYSNANMIRDIAHKLNEFCPTAMLLMVTNQVDMMCHLARKEGPKLTVLGITGGVDSARLKHVISDEMGVDAEGLMIGFHNGSMIPLLQSLTSHGKKLFPLLSGTIAFADCNTQRQFEQQEQALLNRVMGIVRVMGKTISDEQKTALTSPTDTGASILPAMAISRFVSAFCFGQPHTQSYNVLITDDHVAAHYGVAVNTELSIPLHVTKHRVQFDTTFPTSDGEKQHLQSAQTALAADIQALESAQAH